MAAIQPAVRPANGGGGATRVAQQGGHNHRDGHRAADTPTHRDANSDTHRDANSDTHRNE